MATSLQEPYARLGIAQAGPRPRRGAEHLTEKAARANPRPAAPYRAGRAVSRLATPGAHGAPWVPLCGASRRSRPGAGPPVDDKGTLPVKLGGKKGQKLNNFGYLGDNSHICPP